MKKIITVSREFGIERCAEIIQELAAVHTEKARTATV